MMLVLEMWLVFHGVLKGSCHKKRKQIMFKQITDSIALILIAICYSVFESVWRRTQGGGHIKRFYEKFIYPWLKVKSRFVFTALNLVVAACIAFFMKKLSWWQASLFVLSIELFWDMSFGMYMDMGRSYPPTPADIEDYKKTPFNFIIEWLMPKETWYWKWFDRIAMAFRYTWPLLLLPFIQSNTFFILLLGPLVACGYELSWQLFEKF